MLDATKILEWVRANPGYGWVPLLLACVLILLGYEVAKGLLPGMLKGAAAKLATLVRGRQAQLRAEQAIRRFCVATRDVNWIGSLPALAKYDFRLPLESVFVPPRLQVAYQGGQGVRVNLQEFLSANRLACISGAPGSGKSTVLSYIAIAFAREETERTLGLNEARIPICFDCKELPLNAALSGAPELFSSLFRNRGVEVSAAHIGEMLREGRCAIFLDGLDEVGDAVQRRLLLDWLVGVAHGHSDKNRVLVSCRDIEWETGRLPNIQRARLLPFALQDAHQFIEKWRQQMHLSARMGSTQRLDQRLDQRLEALSDDLDGDYEFLYSNPMLLTLAAVLLSLDIPLPRKRSHILQAFVVAMLGEWDALKDLKRNPAASRPVFQTLQRVALAAAERAKADGTIEVSDPIVSAALTSKFGEQAPEPGVWLASIAAASGLLQPAGEGLYAFSNRRIFEFLVACQLVHHMAKWRLFWNDASWKDILMFLPELVPDKESHLAWVQAQGTPLSDMHALFLLNSALECLDANPQMAAAAISLARGYVIPRLHGSASIDDDLARRYMRADDTWFMATYEHALLEMGSDGAKRALVLSTLRAGYMPAAKMLLERYPRDAQSQAALLDALPAFRSAVQLALLPPLLAADMPDDVAKALGRCGFEVLDQLTVVARSSSHKSQREPAVRAIGEFASPGATAFLTSMLGDPLIGTACRKALERNMEIIGAGLQSQAVGFLVSQRPTWYQAHFKRKLDFALAFVTLLATLPVFLVCALLVAATSRGPIFLLQRYSGLGGGKFTCPKFRTMRVQFDDAYAFRQVARSDSRITRVGALLRRTGLDELPSLLSVIRGDMALIGPRPLPPRILENAVRHGFSFVVQVRENIRPGLFGLATLEFARSGTLAFEAETARDLFYAANCSLLFDLRILVRALALFIRPQSAY